MKKILLITSILLISSLTSAAYKDVVKMELTGNCTMDELVKLKNDFNNVMKEKDYDYRAELWMPVFFPEQSAGSIYWVGSAPDLANFGPEFTRYFDEALKSSTAESKVEADFAKCRVELSRSGFLTQ